MRCTTCGTAQPPAPVVPPKEALAPEDEAADGCVALFPLKKGKFRPVPLRCTLGILRALGRKEREQHLFCRVAAVMSIKIHSHNFIQYRFSPSPSSES